MASGALLSNSTRKANASDRARLAISPILTELEMPVVLDFAAGTCHKGASLGKTTNNTMARGKLCSINFEAVLNKVKIDVLPVKYINKAVTLIINSIDNKNEKYND